MSSLSYNKDQYRSHTPFSFVIIGGELAVVQKYNLNLTNKGEASSCQISIPLEGIDTKVFVNNKNKDEHVEVLIYTGYLIDTEDPSTQIKEFVNLINSGRAKNQSRFSVRFDGFASQPEWNFGMTRMLNLSCFDWSQILREYKWETNIKDGDTEVRKVISLIQERVKGLKIIADEYFGSLKLGEIDSETKKHNYGCSGRSYYEILEECAKKMNKNLITLGKNIYITDYKKQPVIWSYYYGSKDSPTYTEAESLTPFENLTLRFGEIGDKQRSDVVVDLTSRTLSKKGKSSITKVRFPENSTVNSLTKYINKTLKNNLSEQELKVLAENIYKKESRKVMTGNINVSFANPFVNLYDLATFVADENNPDLVYMKGINFSINSISEEYSVDGYTQTIDIDSSPEITGRLKERIAPMQIKTNIAYNPIYVGDTSILNRKLSN